MTVDKRVLIADDDADDVFLLKRAMEETGARIEFEWVKDGEELLEHLRQKTTDGELGPFLPRAIILDLNMPKKDGRQALDEIKKDPHLREIPIVVFSTSDSVRDREYVNQRGVSSYYVKPISYSGIVDFANVFNSWLERMI